MIIVELFKCKKSHSTFIPLNGSPLFLPPVYCKGIAISSTTMLVSLSWYSCFIPFMNLGTPAQKYNWQGLQIRKLTTLSIEPTTLVKDFKWIA
jgi:hypothetical protein